VDQLLPAAAASSLLLLVELDADKTMPTTLTTLAASCAALGEAEVHAIAQRLRSKKLDAVARRLRESVQARRTLVQVELFLERLLAGETLFAADGDLCVFRPDQAGPRNGVGVIVSGEELRRWRLEAMPQRLSALVRASLDHMAWGQDAPGEAAVVIPGFLAIRPHVAGRSFWTQPATLIVLLIVISVSFGLGLFLSFRAMLRESAAMKARADFLTSVTHELKTPLASIRLLAEMLDEGRVKGTEKQQEYYRLLAGESARLTVLIENVLDLGRMERGERAYDLRRSHIDGVVKEAIGVFDPLARRDQMQLEVTLGADDTEVKVDCGAFVQALLNVMENARKYARSGKRLQVQSSAEDGQYQLIVRDFGPGIPDTEREMIFQRFQRGQAQIGGNIAGVGLGLYLARAILRAHGGDLSCEAADGGGTRFRFTLPIAEARREEKS
ncbi:MAG: sensor histidine kinase, partial [Planctomycetota bacterium]